MNGWTLEPASIDEWLRFWKADPHRTRFQHPDWHGLFSKVWPESFKPSAYRLLGPEGTDALLPGSTRRLMRGIATEWTSSPGHTYGGMLGPHSPEAFRQAQQLLLERHASYLWIGNPFTNVSSVMQQFTQTIDLTLKDTVLHAELDRYKNLYYARWAERQGLVLHRWDGGAEAFIDIYKNARDRWQTGSGLRSEYPPEFFHHLFAMDGVDVYSVTDGDAAEPIAMGIFLTAGTHVVSWLTLAKTAAMKRRPYQFLYVKRILGYRAEGFKTFDFNPSGGLGGVVDFKRRFGAVRRHFPEYRGQRAWMRALSLIIKR
jgi:CelD/BcsL family acetyltransferase involved in cellulose biosynthesis